MKKLLPILLLAIFISLFYNSCKKEEKALANDIPADHFWTTAPNHNPLHNAYDTIFTSIYKYRVYIDNQDNIKRLYQYDTTNALLSYVLYTSINDTLFSICKYNSNNTLLNNRLYHIDLNNNRAKYRVNYNYVSSLIDTAYFLYYDTTNSIKRVVNSHSQVLFYAIWGGENATQFVPGSEFSYYPSRISKVDLFGHPYITGDNKLTGTNSANVINECINGPSGPGQGPHFEFRNYYLADSLNYIKKVFTKTNFTPVKGSLAYYTYIVE